MGLLRDYDIDWTVAMRPVAYPDLYEFKLTSNAAQTLKMSSEPTDPEWAPYAVTMYSAFHDFSNRMVSGVGLTPPRSPTTFRFRDSVER